MTKAIRWFVSLVRTIANGQYNQVKEARKGVMIHFDGSVSDVGAAEWFANPACKVSYQWLVLDDGSCVRIAPDEKRAYHAGKCSPSNPSKLNYKDANSAFYGVSAATNDVYQATALQMISIAFLCYKYFKKEGWPLTETWRITGHDAEATPRGRKMDPTGPDKKNPILSVEDIRTLLPLFEDM